ncbi:hypothetical protein GCM10027190_46230 [Spirosoma areae]
MSPARAYTNYYFRYLYPESDGQVVEPVFLNGGRWSGGFSAGVSVGYNYAPGWSVSSGVWFTQMTTRQTRQPEAGEGRIAVHNRFIRLPLLLNYGPSANRLSPYFSLGALTDLPIRSRVVVTRGAESTQYLRLEPNPRPIFHILLSAGAQYTLNQHIKLIAQPTIAFKLGQLGGSKTNKSSYEFSVLTQAAYAF